MAGTHSEGDARLLCAFSRLNSATRLGVAPSLQKVDQHQFQHSFSCILLNKCRHTIGQIHQKQAVVVFLLIGEYRKSRAKLLWQPYVMVHVRPSGAAPTPWLRCSGSVRDVRLRQPFGVGGCGEGCDSHLAGVGHRAWRAPCPLIRRETTPSRKGIRNSANRLDLPVRRRGPNLVVPRSDPQDPGRAHSLVLRALP